MAVNSANVYVGAPDQSVTGAILSAPYGTALPATVVATLNAAFVDSGYVDEDGVTLTPDRSTTSIKDWSRAEVRRVLDEFTAEIGWVHLELSEEALYNYFGDDNVAVTAATVSTGKRMIAKLNASDMPEKSWVFQIKDGDKKIRIVVPRGQVSTQGEITLVTNDAVKLPVTLACLPDANGDSVIIYTDDGVFSA